MRWRRRLPEGRFPIDLDASQRELIGWLVPQLREQLLGVGPTDEVEPGLRRLFPTAHVDDLEAETEFRSSHRDRLLAHRLDALDLVEASLEATEVDEATITAWTQVVNDLRLVLGTQLDVSEDDDPGLLDPDDPEHRVRVIYEVLGWILERLVQAQS